MILAFMDSESRLALGQNFQLGGTGLLGLVAQKHAIGKQRYGVLMHGISQPDMVGLGTLMARRGDAVGPFAIIGDQHQTRGIEIESTNHVQLAHGGFIHQEEDGRVIRILVGADVTFRFVQHEVAIALIQRQHDTVKFNLALLVDVKSGLFDHYAIHSDLSLPDQFARQGTGQIGTIAKKFIEPHAQPQSPSIKGRHYIGQGQQLQQ